MTKIKVITASTRPGRFGDQPTKWVLELAKDYPQATFELVDLKDIALPFLDEPEPAMGGTYTKEHTKQWAKMIDEADGFIIVTPEYNHSYPASLKNAIDFLWKEWNYKPVAFVSYGSHAGGARAVEHLRGVAPQVKLFSLHEQVVIGSYWSYLDENGTFTPSNGHTKDLQALLGEITFWSEKLKPIRLEK